VWRLLARYTAIGGAGFQAAVGDDGFTVLADKLDVNFEAFASPLNCRFETGFCSAFPDTDAPFGSKGSFLNFWPTTGHFEANPPFVPEIMSEMVVHIDELLEKSQQKGPFKSGGVESEAPLSFVVLVPKWEKVKAWEQLCGSKWLVRKLTIDAAKHGFFDGSQHESSSVYRPSSFDSGIFFLQNEAGKAKWPATDEVIEEFCAAMAKAIPADDAKSIEAWEQKMKPLSSSSGSGSGGGGGGGGAADDEGLNAGSAAPAAGDGKRKRTEPVVKLTPAEETAARNARMATIKAQWAELPEAARSEWKGSFRKYKQQMFREMLTASQGGRKRKKEDKAEKVVPTPTSAPAQSGASTLHGGHFHAGTATKISFD